MLTGIPLILGAFSERSSKIINILEEFWRGLSYTRGIFRKVFQNNKCSCHFGRVLEELLVILGAFSERSSKIMCVLLIFGRVLEEFYLYYRDVHFKDR